MSSSISHFKGWIAAIAAFLLIEGTILVVAAPNPLDRTNFLQMSFGSTALQRHFVFRKIREFADSKPTIVQVGDSSGFFGIDPRVVMKHLPDGFNYLNMSCCANLGFNGYYNLLDFMAQRNDSIRYMVLHITPYTMPRPELWDADGANIWGVPELNVFGSAVHDEFLSIKRIFHIPSLAYRQPATDAINNVTPLFYLMAALKGEKANIGPMYPFNSPIYIEFINTFRESHGWTPESDVRGGVYAVECDVPAPESFDIHTMRYKTYIEQVFESFTALAKRHNAKLVIVFQPVGCIFGTGTKHAKAREAIERFKVAHPEVAIPFPLIETWPVELFSVPAHVVRERTDLIGNRLGLALKEIVARK